MCYLYFIIYFMCYLYFNITFYLMYYIFSIVKSVLVIISLNNYIPVVGNFPLGTQFILHEENNLSAKEICF